MNCWWYMSLCFGDCAHVIQTDLSWVVTWQGFMVPVNVVRNKHWAYCSIKLICSYGPWRCMYKIVSIYRHTYHFFDIHSFYHIQEKHIHSTFYYYQPFYRLRFPVAPVPPSTATSSTRGPAALASVTALAVHQRRKGRRPEGSYWDGKLWRLATDIVESENLMVGIWNVR